MASLVHIIGCVFVVLGGWVFVLDVTRGSLEGASLYPHYRCSNSP